MVTNVSGCFGRAVLWGLAELGPVEPSSGDLSLELGVSAWMRNHATSLEEARRMLLEMRERIMEAGSLDGATEPVPLVGRSPRSDVLTLISYVGQLLRRGAAHAGCTPTELARRVSAELPEPASSAIGA